MSHQHHEEVELDLSLRGFNATVMQQQTPYPSWQAMPTFHPSRAASYVWLPQSGYTWGPTDSQEVAAWIDPKEGFRESSESAAQSPHWDPDELEGAAKPAWGAEKTTRSGKGSAEAHGRGLPVSRSLKEWLGGEQSEAGAVRDLTGAGGNSKVVEDLPPREIEAGAVRSGTEAGGSIRNVDDLQPLGSKAGAVRDRRVGGNSEVVDGLRPGEKSKGWMADAMAAVRDYVHDQAARLRRGVRRSVAQLQPDVQFYLSVLLMLTLANSLSILVNPSPCLLQGTLD